MVIMKTMKKCWSLVRHHRVMMNKGREIRYSIWVMSIFDKGTTKGTCYHALVSSLTPWLCAFYVFWRCSSAGTSAWRVRWVWFLYIQDLLISHTQKEHYFQVFFQNYILPRKRMGDHLREWPRDQKIRGFFFSHPKNFRLLKMKSWPWAEMNC